MRSKIGATAMIQTLILTGAVVALTLLMVSMAIAKLWDDAEPAEAAVTPVAKPNVTPARRPDLDVVHMREAA